MSVDRSYRPDIDGIRAIAILGVVLYHSRVPLFTGGFSGVDIFFVISGCLIGGHIFSELSAGTFSYLRFYQRRSKRILPAFYVVLVFIVLAGLIVLSPFELRQLGRGAVAATVCASNIYFWLKNNYFATNSQLDPLLMTWSLGVEEQFYAVVPLLMVLLVRIRRGLLLPAIAGICILSFLVACFALEKYPMLVFYLLPARAWELGVGVALGIGALSWKQNPFGPRLTQAVSLSGLALMLAPLFLLHAGSPFPGLAALPSVAGTALVLAVPTSWINRRLLSVPGLVFIGKISYSWYLWHWPLLAYLRIVSGQKPPAVGIFMTVVVSFIVAVLSFYFIEQPLRRSTRRPVPLLIGYAAVSCALLVMCATLWLSHGFPQRYPALARVEAKENVQHSDSCLADYGIDKPKLSPQCYDPVGTRPVIALLGDSHSAALAPGLRAVAAAQGYGFAQLTKVGCLPLDGAARYLALHPLHAAECFRFNRAVLELVKRDLHIQVVVLSGAWPACLHRDWAHGWLVSDITRQRELPTLDATKELFVDSLAELIRSLEANRKQVIVIDDLPTFTFDPLEKFRISSISARRTLANWLGNRDTVDLGFAPPGDVSGDSFIAPLATSLLQQTLAGAPDATLVNLKAKLCNAYGNCVYRNETQLFYVDSDHVSPDGAFYALRDFQLPAPTSPTQPRR
jgi:peptidoglycan/LPS O-acetylase OafA/YrhL